MMEPITYDLAHCIASDRAHDTILAGMRANRRNRATEQDIDTALVAYLATMRRCGYPLDRRAAR